MVPEDEAAAGSAADAQMDEQTDYVEDQSDLDNQQYERMKAERKSYLHLNSLLTQKVLLALITHSHMFFRFTPTF